MTPLSVSTTIAVLSLVGLALGLVVAGLVVFLLQSTLNPLRKILADVENAKTAPMLEHGVRGIDQISRTQQLAQSVPDLAVRYMNKLGLPVDTEAPSQIFPERGRGGSAGWR